MGSKSVQIKQPDVLPCRDRPVLNRLGHRRCLTPSDALTHIPAHVLQRDRQPLGDECQVLVLQAGARWNRPGAGRSPRRRNDLPRGDDGSRVHLAGAALRAPTTRRSCHRCSARWSRPSARPATPRRTPRPDAPHTASASAQGRVHRAMRHSVGTTATRRATGTRSTDSSLTPRASIQRSRDEDLRPRPAKPSRARNPPAHPTPAGQCRSCAGRGTAGTQSSF